MPFSPFTALVRFQSVYRALPVGMGIIAMWTLVFALASTALSGQVPF